MTGLYHLPAGESSDLDDLDHNHDINHQPLLHRNSSLSVHRLRPRSLNLSSASLAHLAINPKRPARASLDDDRPTIFRSPSLIRRQSSNYAPSQLSQSFDPDDMAAAALVSQPSLQSLHKVTVPVTHAKLHKRMPTTPASSLTTASPLTAFDFASSTKNKPYRRSLSAAASSRIDQGQMDLSKSAAENQQLAGLGIQDVEPRFVSDVAFARTSRSKTQHARTTSIGSQSSNTSTSFRPGQPFTHPMKQTPAAYPPLAGLSSKPSFAEEDPDREQPLPSHPTDFPDEDASIMGPPYIGQRSASFQSAHTPFSHPQSRAASSDINLVSSPDLPASLRSQPSARSSLKRPSRRNTDRSVDFASPPTPSSRTSLDKALGFVAARRSTDRASREDVIQAERRKFDAKEAEKDRKWEHKIAKRRASASAEARRSSSDPFRPAPPPLHPSSSTTTTLLSSAPGTTGPDDTTTTTTITAPTSLFSPSSTTQTPRHSLSTRRPPRRSSLTPPTLDEKPLRAQNYADLPPTHSTALPLHGSLAGQPDFHEKFKDADADAFARRRSRVGTEVRESASLPAEHTWLRFSTWFQTRMLSCGGRD